MSYINMKKYFNCPIFLFLPGLFTDNLNIKSTSLDNKTKIRKYLNKQLYKTMLNVDLVFINNYNTQELLKKYFNINTVLFYFNLIPFLNVKRNKKFNLKKRKYDYGIIVSDFNRKIKNVPDTVKELEGKILLIGKNSESIKKKIKDKDIDCLSLISNKEVQKQLKNIKNIVLKSNYEGCSNVLIEGYYAGCNIEYS